MTTSTTDQGLILPVDGDLNDVTTSLASYNTGVESRLVKRYESAVDRGVRNPSPNKGELSYLIDSDVHERWDGANWRNTRGGVDHFFLPGETGTVNLTFTNQSAFFQQIFFATPFSLAPVVMTNISVSSGVAIAWISRAYNINTTSFYVLVQNVNLDTSSWSAIAVDWVAIARQ